MPIIAVAVAIGASYVAASTVVAVGLTVVSALAVTAAVGATISAVGAVTHNKTLSTVGTVIGAVGAIGGLAAGAGLLGDAAQSGSLFGAAPAAGTADEAAAGTIDAMAGGDMIGIPPAPPGGVGAVDDFGNVIQGSAAVNAASPIVPTGTEMAPQDAAALQANTGTAAASGTNDVGLVTTPPTTPPTGAADSTAPTGLMGQGDDLISTPPAPPTNLGATDPATGQTITSGVNQTTGAVESLPDSSSGLSGAFGGLLSFANKNPVVALGALQAAGSFMAGATSSLTPAQVSALNAQAAANDAAASLTKQQTANLAMPKAVANLAPVTGKNAPLVPQPPPGQPGLMNRAPLTGVAA